MEELKTLINPFFCSSIIAAAAAAVANHTLPLRFKNVQLILDKDTIHGIRQNNCIRRQRKQPGLQTMHRRGEW